MWRSTRPSITTPKKEPSSWGEKLRTVYDRLRTFSKKGSSLDEVLKANPVADLEAKWGQGFLNGERFLLSF